MPIPSLPLEIVYLISLHLADLDGQERRQNGLCVAPVCRLWRKVGMELAWGELGVRLGLDNASINNLLDLPHLLECTKVFTAYSGINSDFGWPEPMLIDADDIRRLAELLSSCPKVNRLALCASPPCDLLGLVSQMPFARSLQHLRCVIPSGVRTPAPSIGTIVRSILAFPSLRTLDCNALAFADESDSCSFDETSFPSTKLGLDSLKVSMLPELLNPFFPSQFRLALSHIIAPSSLTSVLLEKYDTDIYFLQWLAACVHLDCLVLVTRNISTLQSLLPQLLLTVQALTSLDYLGVQPDI